MSSHALTKAANTNTGRSRSSSSNGWVVQVPTQLEVMVFANPTGYHQDRPRYVMLDFQQLPLTADFAVVAVLPPLAVEVERG